MKITSIVLTVGFACITGCSGEVSSESNEDSSAASEALTGPTHFNFAASPLVGPSGPAYFSQIRPAGSEMPDILCPGPTYTATAGVIDSNGKTFTGSAGSCDGSYSKGLNGQIIVHCKTPIQAQKCSVTASPSAS